MLLKTTMLGARDGVMLIGTFKFVFLCVVLLLVLKG